MRRAADFPLWFVRLSGWPVFLTIVGCVFLLMLLLSIVFTKISRRSVVQNAALAVLALAVLAFLLLAVVSFVTRL